MKMARKNKKLGQYFAELMVVIVGITIAFALDNLGQIKKEQSTEKLYLEALALDLEKDIAQLTRFRDSTNTILKNVGESFQYIYSNQPTEAFRRRHITSTYTAPYFHSNNGTYISLINSGDMNVISDFELRTSIVDLYSVAYSEMEQQDVFIKKLVDDQIYPHMLKHITFSGMRDGIESSDILKDNFTINLMGSYLNFLNRRQVSYESVLNRCKALKELISSKL